ncbi:hypothetical protein COLO4_30807 [Corchorus olitorius]|uniref:PGG domain-containing protein n=1 Tax=Corchorus olitorius TaxID=93759 RepID=A0A1R3H6S1_9ROSI|nr:hypothetical protein COLO4_30807 [Corchorus olitorius]
MVIQQLSHRDKASSHNSSADIMHKDDAIMVKTANFCMEQGKGDTRALAGHLDFTITLLNKKPEFASQLDSRNRSPLHLASAEGHEQVVRALLAANPDACLVFDDEGNIPLHLAIMRGHMGVIQELIRMKPDSIKELVNGDQTIFHLAVRYNKLKALQELGKWVTEDDKLFLLPDHQGNTILHVASMLKHLQIMKHLLSVSSIKASINGLNSKGFTALDLVEQCPRDLRSFQVRDILGTLMLVAAVTATISYQSVMNPPGGVWQQDTATDQFCNRTDLGTKTCVAGTALLAYGYADQYLFFIGCSTFSFVSSLTVILLIISGAPLHNKFCTWILIIAMFIAMVFMSLAFLESLLLLVTPGHIFTTIGEVYKMFFYIWIGLFGFVGLVATIRLLRWLFIHLIKLKRRRLTKQTNGNVVCPMSA